MQGQNISQNGNDSTQKDSTKIRIDSSQMPESSLF